MLKNYMKIFGEYEKQNQDIESLEKDLFLRKIINILTVTEKLKKNKIDTYICIDKEYKKILFEFEFNFKENNVKTKKSSIDLILNIENKQQQDFFDKHHKSYIYLCDIERELDYYYIENVEKYNNKIKITKEDTDWIKLICLSVNKKNYYNEFLMFFINENLDNKKITKPKNKV